MNKNIWILFIFIIPNIYIFAQPSYYCAAKAGLNVREKPDASSPALSKIPYGEKVSIVDDNDYGQTTTEGMFSRWIKISHGQSIGYVASAYLLTLTPPKEGQTMKQYAESIGKVAGTFTLENKHVEYTESIEKTIYNNGISFRDITGYEYDAQTMWIPKFNIQQAFVLARLLCPFPELLSTKDAFPSKPSGNSQSGRIIKVQHLYETILTPSMVRFEWCDGGCYSVEIREDESEISITFSGGV